MFSGLRGPREHHLFVARIAVRLILTHLGEEMADQRGQLEIETADDGLAVKI